MMGADKYGYFCLVCGNRRNETDSVGHEQCRAAQEKINAELDAQMGHIEVTLLKD